MSEYKNKVKDLLFKMALDEVFVIADNVRPDNIPVFIEAVKDYIDKNIGNSDSWQIVFNNTYSKIRKDLYLLI